MTKFCVPTNGVESWQALLADPIKHWKTGYSARALAYSWETAQDFPAEVRALFAGTDLEKLELLLAIPEHKVPLPGGVTQSQNDIWVLAKAGTELVSMAVEGKVSETFGPTLEEWFDNASPGKMERLNYLKEQIGLSGDLDSNIRYQLLHRTASAVIEAKRFNATRAVMIVHSFNQSSMWFEDYSTFVSLYGKSAEVGELVKVSNLDNVDLYLGWAKGDARFLSS